MELFQSYGALEYFQRSFSSLHEEKIVFVPFAVVYLSEELWMAFFSSFQNFNLLALY